MRSVPATVVLLGAAVVGLCACGSTTTASPGSPTTDPAVRAAAATAYSAAAARANTAKAALQAGPCTRSDTASLAACSRGLADAEQAFVDDLAQVTFPPEARADADALLVIARRLVAEERAFAASANPQADTGDFSAIQADDRQLASAASALRRDLGLTTASSPAASATP
jgi:hypothetical protein